MLNLNALFDEYDHLLLISSVVAECKRRVLERDGYIRIRAKLVAGGLLEFSEFWDETEGKEAPCEYAYHWQDSTGQLVYRWDNVNHYGRLPNAPHHLHLADGRVEGLIAPPDLAAVLEEIEKQLGHDL